MRVLISGSTGFLGTALIEALTRDGHTIVRLVRTSTKVPAPSASQSNVEWDPVSNRFDAAAAEGAGALVHFAGASIADGRWTRDRKNVLRTSRVDSTRHLMTALSLLKQPPKTILAASAVGYYGSRGDEVLVETSTPGSDFLAALCREWEAEAQRAASFGARVVMLRLGITLDAHQGALPQMARAFKLGAGGRLGSGQQWMSWITVDDAVGVMQFALANANISGPVNVVAPEPVRNRDFARVLGVALHRPAIFPAPAFALRLAMGEMADALLLASQRTKPAKLEATGYHFKRPELTSALAHIYNS